MRTICLAVCFVLTSISPALAEQVIIKVFTKEGVPLEGAEVLVTEPGSCPVAGLDTPKTNEFGKLVCEVGENAVAYAYKPGFVQEYVRLEKGTNFLRLERAGKVSGTVVDKNGGAIEGATVTLKSVTKTDGSRSSFG